MTHTSSAASQTHRPRGWLTAVCLILVLVAASLARTGIAPSGATAEPPQLPKASDADLLPFDSAEPDWYAAVQENIRQSEYHVTWQEQTGLPDLPAAYQAPNRAHNLRTYFDAEGIRIVPRTELMPTWSLSLALDGFSATQPTIAGNQVTYRHDAPVGLSLEYVNDEQGLQQKITLTGSLDSAHGTGEAILALSLDGALAPRLADDGLSITYVDTGSVERLQQGALVVADAMGRALPACLRTQSYSEDLPATSGKVEIAIDLSLIHI